ncbi:MAG: hypothetical protein ACFCU5_18890 [Pleurocapsa sp.]
MEDKKAYQQTMETRLSQIGAKIDELQARTQQAGADTRAKLEEQIEVLKAKRDNVNRRLEEFTAAGESAWESLKSGLQSAWEDLSGAVEEAGAKFRE